MFTIEAVVRELLLTPVGASESQQVEKLDLTLDGIVGDAHHGATRRSDSRRPEYPRGTVIRNERQVSIVCPGELMHVAAALRVPRVLPEWLRANLVLDGVPMLSVQPANTVLQFPGGAALIVSRENGPCRTTGRVIQRHYPDQPDVAARFVLAAQHRRGLVAVVDRPGTVARGDTVLMHIPVDPRDEPF